MIIIGIIISSISCFYGGFYLSSHILGKGSPTDTTGNGLTALTILIFNVIFIFFHTCMVWGINSQKSEKIIKQA